MEKLLGDLLSPLAAVKGYVTVAMLAAVTVFVGIHLAHDAVTKADLVKTKTSLGAWQTYGVAEKAAFDGEHQGRLADQHTAQASANAGDAQCSARVAEARRSASAITELLNKEPAHDPQTSCPMRSLMDAGQLRDALDPPVPGAG